MAGPCYYVWFRLAAGDGLLAGQIIGNHSCPTSDYDADSMRKTDGAAIDVDYGALETEPADFDAMESSVPTTGSYGKHVDDPEGTPTLADGDPS